MATPGESMDDIFLTSGRLRSELLSESAGRCLQEALRLARETRWDSVRSPHIFMGVLAHPDRGIISWGERIGIPLSTMLEQFQELFHQENGEEDPLLLPNREFFSDNVIRLLREAHNRAQDHHRPIITPMDLLITLLTTRNS